MAITNGIPLINGVEYGWADITLIIAGVPISGFSAIEYDDDQDIKNIYRGGRYPSSRGKGRISLGAKITISMAELLAIQAKSVNGRIQDIAPFTIQVSYIPDGGKIVHDIIHDCQFKRNQRKWKEGDVSQDVELELVISKITWHKN